MTPWRRSVTTEGKRPDADGEICASHAGSGTHLDCICLHAPDDRSFLKDPYLRKLYARHFGGVNLGFLDVPTIYWTGRRLALRNNSLRRRSARQGAPLVCYPYRLAGP